MTNCGIHGIIISDKMKGNRGILWVVFSENERRAFDFRSQTDGGNTVKKIAAILLAMLLCVSAFSGCGSDKNKQQTQEQTEQKTEQQSEGEEGNLVSADCKGQVLTFNLGVDSQTLDPAFCNAADSMSVINNTFEGLMRDTGSGAQPAMAADLPQQTKNQDGTVTLTYTLREAAWSDGQPVKAQDFEYAWKRCADPKNEAPNAHLMSVLAGYYEVAQGQAEVDELGVKALDDSTLEVTLSQETPYFNNLLCLPAFFPLREDLVGSDDSWSKDPALAVSNGPFTLAGYTQGKEFVLQKNEQYWNQESVSLDYLVARMLDENFAPVAMAFGDLMLTNGQVSQPQDQKDTDGNVVEVPELPQTLEETTVATNRTVSLVVNANTGNPLLKDKTVRAALSAALDRTAAAQAGGGEAMLSLSGTAGELLSAQPSGQTLSLEGEGIELSDKELEIVYLQNEKTEAALQTVKSAWEALGLSVVLTAQDAETFQRSRNSLQYADLLCSVWETDAADPMLALVPYLSSNQQSGCGYSNPEFDQLMLDAMQAEQESEKTLKLKEAEQLLLGDADVMPLYREDIVVTSDSARVTGWTVSQNGTYWFGGASLV